MRYKEKLRRQTKEYGTQFKDKLQMEQLEEEKNFMQTKGKAD